MTWQKVVSMDADTIPGTVVRLELELENADGDTYTSGIAGSNRAECGMNAVHEFVGDADDPWVDIDFDAPRTVVDDVSDGRPF